MRFFIESFGKNLKRYGGEKMIGLFLWILFLMVYAILVFDWWFLLLIFVVAFLAANYDTRNKRRNFK